MKSNGIQQNSTVILLADPNTANDAFFTKLTEPSARPLPKELVVNPIAGSVWEIREEMIKESTPEKIFDATYGRGDETSLKIESMKAMLFHRAT